jgi:hypothetical protein
MTRRNAGRIAASVLLLGLGCYGGQDEGREPLVTSETNAVVIGADDNVRVHDGRVWLDLSEGRQLAALEQLAKAADFDLDLDPHAIHSRPVAFRLEGVTLAEAVAALVGDASFAFEYAFDNDNARHEIAILHVGAADTSNTSALRLSRAAGDEAASSAAVRPASDAALDAHDRREQELTREVCRRARVEIDRERIAELQSNLRRAEGDERRGFGNDDDLAAEASELQLLQALSDPNPAVRKQMLEEVDLDSGDARDQVGRLADEDPNPGVRAAAAEVLGDDGTFQAVADLVGMLDDPSAEVLLATLEALDGSGDESIVPYVAPLAGHPNALVREMAGEMLEAWE